MSYSRLIVRSFPWRPFNDLKNAYLKIDGKKENDVDHITEHIKRVKQFEVLTIRSKDVRNGIVFLRHVKEINCLRRGSTMIAFFKQDLW